MAAEIRQDLVPVELYRLKCPYPLNPGWITIHNTANSASAAQEAAYVKRNPASTSCHVFVDDQEAVQVIPFDRNAWHAGDGAAGTGNRESIGIEICYSTDYQSDRFYRAVDNAVAVTRQLMKRYGIPVERVVQHHFWTGKDCPHRMRAEGTWSAFIQRCAGKEDAMASFIEGYQKLSWAGQTVHVYKQKADQEIGLLSAGSYGTLKPIDKIDDDHVHYCKVNCSYFVMSGAQKGQVLGREQSFTRDQRPDQAAWLDTVVLNDNRIVCGQLASWQYPKSEVKLGYSPAVVLLQDGKDVTLISPDAGKAKYTNANTQTLHMQGKDGRHVLACVSGKLNGEQCRNFAKAYGMSYCAMLDSGGSTQMVVNGERKVYTGRALPNGLTLYQKAQEQPAHKEEEKDGMFYLKVNKGTYACQGKRAVPTRKSATGTYDTSYPLFVGEVFAVSGDPIASKGQPVYQIATGRQKGRYVLLESGDMMAGYFIPVIKP